MSALVGYFGKLPSRGDFLRYRLPDHAVQVLDGWIARNMGTQLQRHGASFDAIWERAPPWRFRLAPGRLDPQDMASGLWMPSIDRAGRCFPMLLVVLHPPGSGVEAALDALSPALLRAIQFDAPPEELQAAIDATLPVQPRADEAPVDSWQRPALHDGSPVRLSAALPEADGFDLLLRLLPQEQDAG